MVCSWRGYTEVKEDWSRGTCKQLWVFACLNWRGAPFVCKSYGMSVIFRVSEVRRKTVMIKWTKVGCTVVWWLAPSPHSKRVPGLIPSWGLSVWSLHDLPVYAWVLTGYSGFLPPSRKNACKANWCLWIVSRSECEPYMVVCLCVALWWTGNLSRVNGKWTVLRFSNPADHSKRF